MKKTDFLFGDFNINALCTDSYSNLRHALTNYKIQITTHLVGALLDHVYIADSLSEHKTIVVIKIFIFQTMMLSFHISPNKNNDVNEDIDFNIA